MKVQYLVDVAYEDYEDNNHYCDTYGEAVEYAKKQNNIACGIYKLVAVKDEYTNELEEEEEDNMLDRTIILYADDFDHDVWEEYCDVVGASHCASSITIRFDHRDVEVGDEEEGEEDEDEITEEDYEDQFGSEMAIRICRANCIPLSYIEKYGSDAYWINDGINNLQDLDDIYKDFVIPTGDEDLIRDYREEFLKEEE